MLRIAICDDEADARDALRFQLEKALMEKSEEIVYEFSAGSNAVSWLGKHPGEVDLLFLDIEMKGLNGMETAKQIRTFDEQIMIVFLTGYSEFVFEGYSVGALDYMLKPVTAQKLMEVLCRVRTRLEQEEDKAFSFKNADGTWRFLLQDILCFCSDKRIVTLVTEQGEYYFYAKLDEIEARLGGRFVRIHQRYLVNPAEIKVEAEDGFVIATVNGEAVEEAMKKIARSMLGGC